MEIIIGISYSCLAHCLNSLIIVESILCMDKGISVVICCYNSAWVIRRALDALKEQRFNAPIPFEIVLVDNLCSDDTVAIAKEVMKNVDVDFRIVKEDNPGLANARRKGIKEVKYDYVLYCDDDNLLCPDYVGTMATILDQMPEVGAVGGKGIAEFEVEPPQLVRENLESYAVGSQLEHRDWLFGAGLAMRTALVRDVYDNQKCYLMGRRGKELLAGDDSELVLSIVLRGYKVYATDDVWFTHVLRAGRLTETYYYGLYDGFQLSAPVIEAMRAALYETGFHNMVMDYLTCCKMVVKYSVLRRLPEAYGKRRCAKDRLRKVDFWGLPRLYKIYRDCLRIKWSCKEADGK